MFQAWVQKNPNFVRIVATFTISCIMSSSTMNPLSKVQVRFFPVAGPDKTKKRSGLYVVHMDSYSDKSGHVLRIHSEEPDEDRSILIRHFDPSCRLKLHIATEKKGIIKTELITLHNRAEVLVKSLETTFTGSAPNSLFDSGAIINHLTVNGNSLAGFVYAAKKAINRRAFNLGDPHVELLGAMNPIDGHVLRPRNVCNETELYQKATILGQHAGVAEQCKWKEERATTVIRFSYIFML